MNAYTPTPLCTPHPHHPHQHTHPSRIVSWFTNSSQTEFTTHSYVFASKRSLLRSRHSLKSILRCAWLCLWGCLSTSTLWRICNVYCPVNHSKLVFYAQSTSSVIFGRCRVDHSHIGQLTQWFYSHSRSRLLPGTVGITGCFTLLTTVLKNI